MSAQLIVRNWLALTTDESSLTRFEVLMKGALVRVRGLFPLSQSFAPALQSLQISEETQNRMVSYFYHYCHYCENSKQVSAPAVP